jgi:hypothetical protein
MAEKPEFRWVLRINANRSGTGVAEMLERHTPLLQSSASMRAGRHAGRRRCPRYDALYNMPQGEEDRFSEEMPQQFVATNRENARRLSSTPTSSSSTTINRCRSSTSGRRKVAGLAVPPTSPVRSARPGRCSANSS